MNIFWVMIIAVFMNGELVDAGPLSFGEEETRFYKEEECIKFKTEVPILLADYFPPEAEYQVECVKIEELPKGGAKI